ncbi:flavin reductase family protein [Cohnella sp.]|uniref:flavin reductase family protein n=1 Tax=Cohnella sp. TaxID=1883426 RepID=UPI0035688701
MILKTSPTESSHLNIQPKILYYGMPVILVTTLNEDGTTNISPLSSSWALGRYLVLGMGLGGKGLDNLQQTPELVINIPGASMWRKVEKLGSLTGKYPVPDDKARMGYRYEPDKFTVAGLTPDASLFVKPQRIAECPLQIECTVKKISFPDYAPLFAIVETEALQIYALPDITKKVGSDHIDPSRWNPLIYNFRHYFGLGDRLGTNFRAEV